MKLSYLPFPIFTAKKKRNYLEIALEATYGLHLNRYSEILTLTFGGRNLVTRCFRLYSNSRGSDEIRDLPISIDFYIDTWSCYSCLILCLNASTNIY